jgi:cell division protein FtsL
MSALAQPARVERGAARSGGRRRLRAGVLSRRIDRGVLWIAVLALLLAGVVAVNVAVLQLNVQLDGLGRERAGLRAETQRLRAELSSVAANAQIEKRARTELGLVEADSTTTRYVDLSARR